jgi:hypothetical protein
MELINCPVCGSPQVVVSLAAETRPLSCEDCEATWEQRGGRQRGVRPGNLRGVPGRRKEGLATFPLGE